VRDPDRWARPTGAILREIRRSSPRAPLRSSLDREVDVRIHSQDMAVYSLLELLSVVLSIEKLMCVSTARIWPCTALSCTVSGVSATQ
jgi:hypothetical protein